MAVQFEDVRLLANHNFRRLVEARAVAQIGQNAMLYTLLILVVNETGSSIHSTLLVTAWSIPSILLGIPAGALADVLPRRALLIVGNVLKTVLVAVMILYTDNVWTLYALLLVFSLVNQFTAPAESAALPSLMRRDQLAGGNAWMLLTVMIGQAAGAVLLAPIILKVLGSEFSLGASAITFAAAAFVVSSVIGLRNRPLREEQPDEAPSGAIEAVTSGWAVLRSSRPAFLAFVYLTVVATLAKALTVLTPHYTSNVLNIETENTVFVVAPAAIGAGLALIVTPPLTRWFGPARITALGFVLFVLGIASLGLVVWVRDFILENLELKPGLTFVEKEVGVSSVITMAMILAIPVGFALTMVNVAGKAVLNREAPAGRQARVFATQGALSDGLALIPLFAIGGVAELLGVRAVLLIAAVAALLAGVYLTFSRRFGPPPPELEPAGAEVP